MFPSQVEKLENEILGFTNEIRLLQQTIQKLEKQLTTLHAQNESLEQNERSYREKVMTSFIIQSNLSISIL
jgi:prefoldin subunit 5